MRSSSLLFLLAFLLASACVEMPDPESGVEVDGSSSSEGTVRTANLQAASPAEGSVVSGDFVLAAVVDGEAKVRFLLNGRELVELNERPYQVGMDGCSMTVGNHFFVVEVEDDNGEIQDLEQWFTVKSCD